MIYYNLQRIKDDSISGNRLIGTPVVVKEKRIIWEEPKSDCIPENHLRKRVGWIDADE
jgi:hypothetical protein